MVTLEELPHILQQHRLELGDRHLVCAPSRNHAGLLTLPLPQREPRGTQPCAVGGGRQG